MNEKKNLLEVGVEEMNDLTAQIYDKRINFLIGSGASADALPTLSGGFKMDNNEITFEELVSVLEENNHRNIAQLLFKEHYFEQIIKPAYEMNYEDQKIQNVFNNYKDFFIYILSLLNIKRSGDTKRCNVFSTNYDLFMECVADSLIREKHNFILNDGSDGFKKKILNASNFNKQVNNTGIFDKFISEIPMINLIKLHGSVSWEKADDEIVINYNLEVPFGHSPLSKKYLQNTLSYEDLISTNIEEDDEKSLCEFWQNYRLIPIVNPTKWKFHETVLEQHYYQMLRLLSYELEKKDVVLITFGFSFRDEHIYDLVRRSLSNPSLTLFIFCHNGTDLKEMREKFSFFKNVLYIFKCKQDTEENIEALCFDDFNTILRNELDNKHWKVTR